MLSIIYCCGGGLPATAVAAEFGAGAGSHSVIRSVFLAVLSLLLYFRLKFLGTNFLPVFLDVQLATSWLFQRESVGQLSISSSLFSSSS